MYTFTRKKNLFLIMILEKKKRIHGKYGRVLGKKTGLLPWIHTALLVTRYSL